MKHIINTKIIIIAVCVLLSACKTEPAATDGHIAAFKGLLKNDPGEAARMLQRLAERGNVPFIEGETVLFFHEADAKSVDWRGDFNRWGGEKPLMGKKVSGSDWWYATATFPSGARLDYKIVINGDEWLEDPLNPYRQLGGAGHNSYFAMPGWQDKSVHPTPDMRGETSGPRTYFSRVLGASVNYGIHQTQGIESADGYGVLVVTDGHEYGHEGMGNLTAQADYLAYNGEITPLYIILVDPRDPDSGENLRADYFVKSPAYLDFIGVELPELYSDLFSNATSIAILGTSFGGFFATQLARINSDAYPHAIIQSPAYWPDKAIIHAWKDQPPSNARRIVVTYGTVFDGGELTAEFAGLMEAKFPGAKRIVVDEGHSWGAWKNQLPDALRHVFGRD